VKRTTFIYTVATVLAMFALLGCGTTNKLQSVELSPTGDGGFINLQGEGSKIQFTAIAKYTNAQGYDMTNKVTYTVTAIGDDAFGDPLPAPPMNVLMSPNGLITAVEPFVCTWVDLNAPGDQDPSSGLQPAWFLAGSYRVVATFKGVASNPVYVAVASQAGNGPNGQCGPSTN